MTGIDHARAPLAVRERFAMTKRQQTWLLETLQTQEGVLGAAVLATCNRTAVWVHCLPGDTPPLVRRLCEAVEAPRADGAYLHSCTGEAAVQTLFETAAGLRSRIFGEDQILTQVKEALERARAGGFADGVIEVLFRMAVTSAKQVKTGLQTALVNTSAVDCALARLRETGYDLRGRRCLVIGNGKMGKLAAQALREAGADVTVTVRQYRGGVVEIPAGCRRIDYGQRLALFPQSELILSATASPNVTVKYEEAAAAGLRPGAVLIDLAVPRDIDPRVASLGVTLWDIDQFSVPETARLAEARAWAGSVLAAGEAAFATWYHCRDLIPRLDALSRRFGRDAANRISKEIPTSIRTQAASGAEKELRRILFAVRDRAGAAAFRQCVEAVELAMDGRGRV